MDFPVIISPIRRRGYRSLAVLLLTSLAACGGDGPITPPPTPQAPTVSCPSNVESSTTGGQPVPIAYSAPSTAGGSAPVSVTCTPASGTLFNPGTTAVNCTATDAAGRSATCGFTVDVRAVPTLSKTRFLAFGDSLTEGKLSLTISLLIDSPAHSYPFKLQGMLAQRYTAQQPVVLNEGFGGERVDESRSRFRAAISQHRPDAVLLMHGVNDLNGVGSGKVQAAVDGMEELIKEGRSAGVAVFVATLPPLGPGPKAGCPECVEPFNERLAAVAKAKGATLVDVYAAWGNRTGLMGADGIHPTEAGYEVIATAFFEALRAAFENPSLQ